MAALSRLSLPLGLVMMLVALGNNIPRYFVEHYWGEGALGIFGALLYLGLAGTTVIGALGQAATPRLSRYYAAGQTAAFYVLLFKLAAVGATMGAIGVVVARIAGIPILRALYGPEYAAQSVILLWLMVAATISYVASLGGYAITAARYFRIQIPLFAVVAGTSAAMCFWLVPRAGLLGAAISLLVASVVQLLGEGLVIVHAAGTRANLPTNDPTYELAGNVAAEVP
jgi:O-antigen/teichoic acid export membrane protein